MPSRNQQPQNREAQEGRKARAGGRGQPTGKSTARPSTSAARGTMDRDIQPGASNLTYDVVSILYHSLQGAETYDKYRRDAEASGDPELVQFIDSVIHEELSRAERAKRLLAHRLEDEEALDGGGGEEDLEDADEIEDLDDDES